MTAVAKKSQAHTFLATFDRWGRRNGCIACGERLRHPANGRPRLVCPDRDCVNAWKRVKRANRPPPRWTGKDLEEAVTLWRGCYCGSNRGGHRFNVQFAPLPACDLCWGAKLNRTAEPWLVRCKPGCPLPDPFKGGGG